MSLDNGSRCWPPVRRLGYPVLTLSIVRPYARFEKHKSLAPPTYPPKLPSPFEAQLQKPTPHTCCRSRSSKRVLDWSPYCQWRQYLALTQGRSSFPKNQFSLGHCAALGVAPSCSSQKHQLSVSTNHLRGTHLANRDRPTMSQSPNTNGGRQAPIPLTSLNLAQHGASHTGGTQASAMSTWLAETSKQGPWSAVGRDKKREAPKKWHT